MPSNSLAKFSSPPRPPLRGAATARIALIAVLLSIAALTPLSGAWSADARPDSGTHAHADQPLPSAGSLTLRDSANPGAASDIQALALKTRLDVRVRGTLADVTLTQQFRNTTDEWRDARYAFPMPVGAIVRGLQIRVGDRTIRGAVREKQDAQQQFEAAAAEGRVASLVSAARPNLFNTRISAIGPGVVVEIQLDVLLPVALVDQHFELALPTTLTPRYVNRDTPDSAEISSLILPADQLNNPPQLELDLRVPGMSRLDAVASDSHLLQRDHDVITINSTADRDVLLRWPISALDDAGSAATGGVWSAEHAGSHYVQFLLTPPPGSATGTDTMPARELVLVLDRSGSMAGAPIAAAHAAIQTTLDRLNPQDRFNIIGFDDALYPLFARSQPADEQSIAKARRFVRGLDANGGTEIAPALRQAITSSDNSPLTQLVFVTDGSIGYENSLLARIDGRLGERRLFTVGIGNASNRWFLEKAAELGRGEALFVADTYDVQNTMETLLQQLSQPVLANLSIAFHADDGSEVAARLYPDPLPDLYAGRPVMVVAQLTGDATRITATGQTPAETQNDDSDWRHQWTLDNSAPVVASGSTDGLASWWASRHIDHLSDLQRVSSDRHLHREEITDVALAAGLVSEYTSYVAISDTPVRPAHLASKPSEVANAMPAGLDMQAIALPAGASGLDALTRLSFLLASIGALMLMTAKHLGNRAT